jgi:magnesium-transporting ATPase (P-type)
MEPELSSDTSIRSLIRAILTDVRTLVHEEIDLARVEVRSELGRARDAAMRFAIAAAAFAVGATFMLTAVAIGIADLMNWPLWAGFLTVAIALTLVGFIALAAARRKIEAFHAMLQETVSTLKENSEWIAKRLSSVHR